MKELEYQKQLNYDLIGNQFNEIPDIDDTESQRELDYDLIGEMIGVDDDIKDLIIDEEFRAGQRTPHTKEEIYSAMIVLGFLSFFA